MKKIEELIVFLLCVVLGPALIISGIIYSLSDTKPNKAILEGKYWDVQQEHEKTLQEQARTARERAGRDVIVVVPPTTWGAPISQRFDSDNTIAANQPRLPNTHFVNEADASVHQWDVQPAEDSQFSN